MVITYSKIETKKESIHNNYRVKKIANKYLITTDQGSWVALEKKEYDSFIKQEYSGYLEHILEERGIIITKENINKIIDSYKKRISFLFKGTNLHIIIPTLRCNHKCIYCHSSAKAISNDGFDMDEETATKTLEFIFQTPATHITIEFQGGDALLNFDLFKYIVNKAKNMNEEYNKKIRYALVTNLTLLDDQKLDWICKQNIDICTSLDGPKIVHDKNRFFEDGKPSYDVVVNQIKKIKGRKKLSALMVTTRYSLEYWKEIVDEYVKWDFRSLQIKYINKLGFAENKWNEVGYTIEEFLEFWTKSVDYMIELNKQGIKIKERFVTLFLQKILDERDPSFLDARSPCGAVIGQIAYDTNGDIYCCDEGRNFDIFKLGNVKNNTYNEILTKDSSLKIISSSINENYLCDNCVYKPYCGVCPVINYAESGNIIPKISKCSRCKYFKAVFDYIFEKLLSNDEETKQVLFDWHNNWARCKKQT